MRCHHFDAGRCRSCSLLATAYPKQLALKESRVAAELGLPAQVWETAYAGPEAAFRNKAKMVVSGTIEQPILGLVTGVDLRDCPIHEPVIQAALPVLAEFVTLARLQPYDVEARSGELKFVLVTAAPTGELMVRFVSRSQEPVTRIRKHLPWLLERIHARVVTVNLQPEHKAVLEGEREIVLTTTSSLQMPVGDVLLQLRPQSFFQTNTDVAGALYRTAVDWLDDERGTIWDLYCGVGGFALHLARPDRKVIGVETSSEAIESARVAGVGTFVVGDATAYALEHQAPDLVVVNPPRRGIGADLAGWIETSGVRRVLYSSCNPVTLARDLAAMPSYTVDRARLFDMFPHTEHAEVLVLASR